MFRQPGSAGTLSTSSAGPDRRPVWQADGSPEEDARSFQIGYFGAAAALRMASLNAGTRKLYRMAGKLRRRAESDVDHDRSVWILENLPRLGKRLRLLELGTGWAHAYSLYPGLLRDADICCFDVQDNRSWDNFRASVERAAKQIEVMTELPTAGRAQAAARASAVRDTNSFEEAYGVLGISYHVDPNGLPDFRPGSFDAIYSIDVLEHVSGAGFTAAASRWFACLRPGAPFLADFDLQDHLSYYDRTKGPKHYLRYSERTWKRWFENGVQYFNRLTASQILAELTRAGFRIEQATRQTRAVPREDVHPDHQWQSDEDIATCHMSIRARRPES